MWEIRSESVMVLVVRCRSVIVVRVCGGKVMFGGV